MYSFKNSPVNPFRKKGYTEQNYGWSRNAQQKLIGQVSKKPARGPASGTSRASTMSFKSKGVKPSMLWNNMIESYPHLYHKAEDTRPGMASYTKKMRQAKAARNAAKSANRGKTLLDLIWGS